MALTFDDGYEDAVTDNEFNGHAFTDVDMDDYIAGWMSGCAVVDSMAEAGER